MQASPPLASFGAYARSRRRAALRMSPSRPLTIRVVGRDELANLRPALTTHGLRALFHVIEFLRINELQAPVVKVCFQLDEARPLVEHVGRRREHVVLKAEDEH